MQNLRHCGILVLLCLGCVGASMAPMDVDTPNRSMEMEPFRVARKDRSVLNRPKKNNATDQLFYARMLRDAGKLRKAANEYTALVHSWHDSKEAQTAQFEYARLLEERGKYLKAFYEYQYLIDNYAGGFEYEDVLEGQFRIANYVMTTKKKVFFVFTDSRAIERAVPMFELIAESGPGWGRTPEARFNVGLIHEKTKSWDKAIEAYEGVQQRYPNTTLAVDAAFRKGYCLYVLAGKRPHEERSWQVARAHLRALIAEYPAHEYVEESREQLKAIETYLAGVYYDRAVYYDKRLKKPKAALIAYRDFLNKFPDSEMGRAAMDRVAALRELADADGGGRGEEEPEGVNVLVEETDVDE